MHHPGHHRPFKLVRHASSKLNTAPSPLSRRHRGHNNPAAPLLPSSFLRAVVDRPDVEADVRYNRVDFSSSHAYAARWQFMRNIARGEPGMGLAEAALQVAAEDDAIASHSTVPFPVHSYLARVQKLADEFDLQKLQPLKARLRSAVGGSSSSSNRERGSSPVSFPSSPSSYQGANGDPSPEAILAALDEFLAEQRFTVPAWGRSNLPPNAVVDHPGVWEDARWAYFNEMLIRRRGHASIMAILFSEIVRRLLAKGSINFAVSMDTRGFVGQPRPVVLPGITRENLLRSSPTSENSGRWEGGGGASSREGGDDALPILNTCSSDTISEMLRHLKRAYWPLSWDTSVDAPGISGGRGSHGGFLPAAKAAAGEQMTAQLRAISTVANARLERGVWTSPGAGDVRRCRAACERLVLLGGEGADEEQRDLALILFHGGDLSRAYAELTTYMDSQHFRVNADGLERGLCRKVAGQLSGLPGLDRACLPLTLEGALAGPSPEDYRPEEFKRPLMW